MPTLHRQEEESDDELIDIPDPDISDHKNDKNTDQRVVEDGNVHGNCQICGMLATSRHFGAIACRACGAFFRRSIVLKKDFVCRCSLKKMITDMAGKPFWCRIFCRACRLKRCLEIGMRPEAVRAAHFRRFHEERRATTKMLGNLKRECSSTSNDSDQQHEEMVEMKPDLSFLCPPSVATVDMAYSALLNTLLPLEPRMHRISASITVLPIDYYSTFHKIEDLIDCKENLLDQYSRFSEKKPTIWPRAQMLKNMESKGFWKCPQELDRFMQNLMLSVDMIKTMPVFPMLNIEDQKTLLKDSVRKATHFLMSYLSLYVSNEAIVWTNGANIFEIFAAVARHYKSELVVNAAYKVYINPMREMSRVRPSKEEFVLLLAILVSNPASHGLSENAKVLLNEEAEKYGKVLMQFEQTRVGQSGGVLRYMELQGLLWNAIASTFKVREIYAYFDTVLDQGCFNRALLPIFRQLTLEGPNV